MKSDHGSVVVGINGYIDESVMTTDPMLRWRINGFAITAVECSDNDNGKV